MAKRILSRAEVVSAHSLLNEHLKKEPDGFFKFDDDWDDARIAAIVGKDIPASTIGKLRVELFGKINRPASGIDNARLKELETTVNDAKMLAENLLNCFKELELKHNKLIDNLMVNKVIVNIAHLKTTHKEGDGK